MKILIAGSTGLVGTALVQDLRQGGHTVCRLVRPETDIRQLSGAIGFDVKWDPSKGKLGAAAVGVDAVVNLAGASIAQGRWTRARKNLLRTSRVDHTHALVNALSKMAARPRVFISASAIGYYGDRGDELLSEDSPSGTAFLSELARDWEAEAEKSSALGIRVVQARFGLILAKHGGALPRMLAPFRLGVGGRVGTGKQWMSWITLADVVAILRFALENDSVRGPINVVTPQPMRNTEFTAALAKAVHRPALFPAPAFALRLALGEMADALLLSSQRVVPQQLDRLGYDFVYKELVTALDAVLSPSQQ